MFEDSFCVLLQRMPPLSLDFVPWIAPGPRERYIYIYIYMYMNALSFAEVSLVRRKAERPPRNNIINIISCYCTVKTIEMLQLRPFKCYS